MAETMSPSANEFKMMTLEQSGKVADLVFAALRRAKLPAGPSQQVIEKHGGEIADNLVVDFRRRVEMLSDLIVRTAKVNRGRSPQEAIEATLRAQYTDRSVVDAMPKGNENDQSDEVDVVFFRPDLSERNGHISDGDLEKEFELRGLKPADPVSVAAVNEADPAFADKKPHGTHWKDTKGNWCHATFSRWADERRVGVSRIDYDWSDDWWFAGVRK